MKRIFGTIVLLGTLLGAEARASCPTAYGADLLAKDLGAMSEALRSADRNTFQQIGDSMTKSLPCVDSPLAPVVLANVYRYAGLSALLSGDTPSAQGWFRTALELDSSFDWDVKELAIDDPIRMMFSDQREAAGVEKEDAGGGRELREQDGTRVLVDGRVLTQARLTPNRPHLIQQVNVADNAVIAVWIVDGARLPDALLGEAPVAVDATDGGEKFNVQKIERTRPPMKTPTLILGGLGVAGGIGLYAMSFQTKKRFQQATTTAELERTRTATNGLVLGAGSAIVIGSGLTYLGVILDGGAGVQFRGTF